MNSTEMLMCISEVKMRFIKKHLAVNKYGNYTMPIIIHYAYWFCDNQICPASLSVTYCVVAPSLRFVPHMYWKMISQWLFWSPHECWLVHSMGRTDPS